MFEIFRIYDIWLATKFLMALSVIAVMVCFFISIFSIFTFWLFSGYSINVSRLNTLNLGGNNKCYNIRKFMYYF